MSTRINHNMLSLTAQRAVWTSQNDLDSAVQRLSSGLRINYAWDDPTGLGISERLRSSITGMVEAEKNASYNVNMLQTAEGALAVIDEKLVRMRAIAVQASNGILTTLDRQVANVEFQQLKSEVNRIAQTANYNGYYLLDGSHAASTESTDTTQALGYNAVTTAADGDAIKFHIGESNQLGRDYYYLNLGGMTASDLGIDGLNVADTASSQAAIDTLIAAINSKDTERTFIGSMVERLQNTILNLKIQRENATASESQIRDADFAEEMSNFTRAQILMQTGVSMLSTANGLPNIVAQLVG
ncbi:MAG: flagellin [Calditrichaeota bacterium]|nr:flagellin [Calditrichota bacterium]MCB9368779.1 flagellin [Calditrichota bacterium]